MTTESPQTSSLQGTAGRGSISSPPGSSPISLDVEIAVLDRFIAQREEGLRALKRRRKAAISRRLMAKMRGNPDTEAKRLATLRAHFDSDEVCIRAAARLRMAALRTGVALPDMTDEQRKEYKRLRYKMSRADALKIMGIEQ